jgi:hypothetical protein
MWLGVLLLLGFLVFMWWDGRQLRRSKPTPLSREVMARGILPSGLVQWHFWLGASVVTALLAVSEWGNPSKPPFTGRWGWLSDLAYDALGFRGKFWLCVLFSVLALCYGLVLWHRVRKGAKSAS